MAERPYAARVALIGLPASGKTSLFCALTHMDTSKAVAATGRTLSAAVPVLEEHVEKVQAKVRREKLVLPLLELTDGPPLALEGPERQNNPGVFAGIREADGYVIVLKAYDGEADPRRQWEAIRSELHLADLDVMNKRIDKLRNDLKRPSRPKMEDDQRELEVLERLVEAVAEGDSLESVPLTPEDEKRLRGFQLFSKKPLIPVVNMAETALGSSFAIPGSIPVCIKLEVELLGMPEEERFAFMKDYGLSSLTLSHLLRLILDRMGIITFITVGDKDVTGWALKKGQSAYEAAGKIHKDIQKGFINAEIIAFEDWEKQGGVKEATARGRQRTEGKNYVIQPGDILHIKFNV